MNEKYKRPDWDEYFLNIAEEVGKRSTCLRRRYGAVIVKDKIIVSTGYNGAPRGEANCIDTGVCERERLHVPKGERYELCIAGDSVIKLLDGSCRTIKELAEVGEPFMTYAVDTKTGEIVPAKAELPRKTGTRNDIVSVTFDNGKRVVCTADHKFLLTDCTYKAASELDIQDSVMPMYYGYSQNDFNLLNDFQERVSDKDCKQYQSRIVKGISLLIGKMAAAKDSTEITIETYPALQRKYRYIDVNPDTIETIPPLKTILKCCNNNFKTALQAARRFNHRVINIERIDSEIDVYDLTVPIYHNFPIDLGDNSCVFTHNCCAVHGEQNAIINGDPQKMKDATIYIVGINVADGSYASGEPCLLCRRMIKNAQIAQVICRNTKGEIVEVDINA